jgi:hypothetical protein
MKTPTNPIGGSLFCNPKPSFYFWTETTKKGPKALKVIYKKTLLFNHSPPYFNSS